MDSQKQFSGPEIQFLLSCSEADENEMINCEEFANRFQEPARDIGFNVAVLLTNLSEHVPHDPRLHNFLELAESILEYFRPYLGRIEIMGASRRIERIYFEISETNRAQWEMPQVGGHARVHARLLGLRACGCSLPARLDPTGGRAVPRISALLWQAHAHPFVRILPCCALAHPWLAPGHFLRTWTTQGCTALGHEAGSVCPDCGCSHAMLFPYTHTLGALAGPYSPDAALPTLSPP